MSIMACSASVYCACDSPLQCNIYEEQQKKKSHLDWEGCECSRFCMDFAAHSASPRRP